jgi:peptidoglycan/LPS O-acetylase OafA/YrhL
VNNNVADIISVLIPVIAIIMGIGIGMFSLYLQYRKKRDMLQLHHAERMAAIEKGIELPTLPPEFFQETGRRELAPIRNRRIGLILLFLGIAIAVALWGTHIPAYWWGLVPAAIGLAFLLSSLLEAREQKKASPVQGGPPAHL